MDKIKELRIHVISNKKRNDCSADLMHYSHVDAIKKAVLAYLATLVLVCITLFIPLVHFIAVPGLLLLGPFLSYLIYKAFAGQKVLRINGASCPSCQKKLSLDSDLENWPLRDRCDNCGEHFLAELE